MTLSVNFTLKINIRQTVEQLVNNYSSLPNKTKKIIKKSLQISRRLKSER